MSPEELLKLYEILLRSDRGNLTPRETAMKNALRDHFQLKLRIEGIGL